MEAPLLSPRKGDGGAEMKWGAGFPKLELSVLEEKTLTYTCA